MRHLGRIAGALVALASTPVSPALAGTLAATPLVETYGVADGLPSSRVQALAQDRDGYLWIATRGGLARFDGVDFRTWRHDPGDPGSLASEDVQVLFVDRDNRLWVGGDGGLSMLDASREKITNGNGGDAGQAPLAGGDVWSLEQDAAGAIWVGTYARGLQRLDANGGAPLVLRHADGDAATIASDDVVALELDDRARLWVGTSAGLSLLQPATAGAAPRVVAQFLPGELIVSLRADRHGHLWVGTRQGVLRRALDAPDDAGFEKFALPREEVVRSIAFDRDDRPWFATSRGAIYAPDDVARVTIARDDLLRLNLPSNLVWDTLHDREGGTWFALAEGGLAHLSPHWRNFSLLRARPDPSAGEPDPAPRVIALCADGNVVSAATALAALRFDAATGAAVRVAAPWPDEPRPQSVPGVACTADGAIWLSHRGGLVRYRPDTRESTTWRTDPAAPDAIAPGLVDLIAQAPDGTVWVSSRGSGLQRIDVATGAVRRYDAAVDGPRSLEAEALQFDATDALWIAGERGLSRHDAAADRFVEITGLADGRVDALAFGADGTLWYHQRGTLVRARVDGAVATTLATIGAAQGLPPGEIGGMVRDRAGAMWLSGPSGLFRVDAAGNVRAYGRFDGLQASEFSDAPPVIAPDGTIFAASVLGIVAFDPARLRDDVPPPPVYLHELSVWRDGGRRALDATRALTLEHSDRDLRVVVRALALATPRENRYAFALDGFDNDWVPAGADGTRVFSQLPEGTYTLRVRGAAPHGAWREAPFALSIAAPAPPWRTNSAYAAYAIGAAVLALLAFLAWRRRVERRHALALAEERRQSAEQQNQAKSDFLADVGHEIRTPMTGLLGMNELLLRSPLEPRQREYAEAVARSGAHLLKLINDLLDLSRIEAGRLPLEPTPIDLWALVDEVITMQRPLASQRGLALTAQFAPDTPREVLADAVRVKEILLNLINNALKFTERGRVDVRIAADATRTHGVVLEVADTGPGMSQDAVARLFARFEQASAGRRRGGSGLGLAITRRLVELMDGAIEVDSRPGHGSVFRARIVLPPAPAAPDASLPHHETVPLPLHGALAVLVIEDDPTIRQVLAELLQSQGHRVVTGANGLDALRLIAEQAFDLALFDLDLPGVDGLKLIRLVRQRESAGTRLPAIAVTANSTAGIDARAREAGFDGFLRKPITLVQLQAAVAEVVA